jgi:hypothetical protein
MNGLFKQQNLCNPIFMPVIESILRSSLEKPPPGSDNVCERTKIKKDMKKNGYFLDTLTKLRR